MEKSLLLSAVVFTLLLTSCSQPAASPTPTTALAQELRVQTDDVTLHVRIAGDPKAGDVLVAAHGGPGNSSDYMLSLEQLASTKLAVVNYDQRGTGQSTEPSKGYAMRNYITDVVYPRRPRGRAAGRWCRQRSSIGPLLGWIGRHALCHDPSAAGTLNHTRGKRCAHSGGSSGRTSQQSPANCSVAATRDYSRAPHLADRYPSRLLLRSQL
jgi:hypothetical protein